MKFMGDEECMGRAGREGTVACETLFYSFLYLSCPSSRSGKRERIYSIFCVYHILVHKIM